MLADRAMSLVLRNSVYNLLGLGLPLLAAVVTIPLLIEALGVGRFGILTLIWAIVSYFGVFDLGLGRAVTQRLAIAIAKGRTDEFSPTIGTANVLMVAIGVVTGTFMAIFAPAILGSFAGADSRALAIDSDATIAVYWLALGMPFIVLTAVYRGAIEATERFDIINYIRLPMGLFTFIGPAAVVVAGSNSLTAIAAVLVFGRILACLVHAFYARRVLRNTSWFGTFDPTLVKPMVAFGGWLSLTGFISPLMNYADRFVIGAQVSLSSVTFYVTPQELAQKLSIIPGAIGMALFPNIAAAVDITTNELRRATINYSLIVMLCMLPFTLFLTFLAHPILALWINDSFADQSYRVLQIISIAMLVNSVAQIPYTMLVARGHAKRVAVLHLSELVPYIALLILMSSVAGVVGAAFVFLARTALDTVLLFIIHLRSK